MRMEVDKLLQEVIKYGIFSFNVKKKKTHYCYLTYFGYHVLVFVHVILYFFLTINFFWIALTNLFSFRSISAITPNNMSH